MSRKGFDRCAISISRAHFSNFSSTNNPDPTKYLTYEAGVHGWPSVGLYYDVSVFQVNVKDRIESRATHPDRDHQCEHR